MKVNKPPMVFFGHLYLKYKGRNSSFFFENRFFKIKIIEIDYDLKEELLVSLTMFDETEIKFSMISANLYIKVNGKYELQETQGFCDFNLLLTDELMLFEGFIFYLKKVIPSLSIREDFDATITLENHPKLLEIWKKHHQLIID